MDDSCSRFVCLTYGWEWCPRGLSLEGGGEEMVLLPVCGVVVETPAGWVLLETGIGPALRDPVVAAPVYGEHPPRIPGTGEPVEQALAACGLRIEDIALVAVSHLHVDHAGGLGLFSGGPPVLLQEREWAFAQTPAAADQAYVASDYADPGLRWKLLDGDASIAPGLDAISTPGHTPGHMSFRVRLRDGATWLFAIDAIDLQEGIDTDTEIGSSADPADAPLRRRSHDRLVRMAREERATLVAGHCPVTWPARPAPPVGYLAG